MNFEEYDNSIFIIEDKAKDSIIKNISNKKQLLNIKFITLNELKKKYYFDYTKEAIFYVSKKYEVISDIAEIYISNLYYIKDIDNEKVKFLAKIKKELEDKKLLIKNPQFKAFLKNKKIVLYNVKNTDKFYHNIFKELKKYNEVIEYESGKESSLKKLYKASNKDEEITFVATSIAKLIKSNININKIKLANVNSDYYFTIKKIFKEYNIPIELPTKEMSSGRLITKKFKEYFADNIEYTLEKVKTYVNDETDKELYQGIINVLNKYTWSENFIDVKDMVFKDIDAILLNRTLYKNAVRVIDFSEEIMDDEYIFLINFNQGIIPVNIKDEDYLNDDIKEKLDISTSIDLNIKQITNIRNKIRFTKNLVVTYSTHNLNEELYISNAYDESLFINETITKDYTLSNSHNLRVLVAAKDEYKKFGTITEDLIKLNSHYKEEKYCSYDNTYKQIDNNKIYNYIGNKLILSYTSMNNYYQCAFKYYLENILKLSEFEDTFQTLIGSIFHQILSVAFKPNFDLEKEWNLCMENVRYTFNNMEKFFLNILKEELTLIIDTINTQMEYTELKNALYEKEFIIPIDEKKNVAFKGILDKVLYQKYDNYTVVSVIDYKTGNPTINLKNAYYGLDMQLPIYAYLLKKSSKEKVRIGGFYLQNILSNLSNREKRIESLKLQGYSNSNIEILEKVDSTYNDSKMIRSLRTSQNGFYSYSKVLSDNEIDKLSDLVEKKIKEAVSNIINANFAINPKEIDASLVGCKFCPYKSICYMKNADIVKYKSVQKEEIFGGDVDA